MRVFLKPGLFALALALALAPALPASAGFLSHRDSNGYMHIDPLLCLTDYQIRQKFAAAGYTHVLLNAPIESQIQIKADKGNATYRIDFNFCDNRIDSVQRIR